MEAVVRQYAAIPASSPDQMEAAALRLAAETQPAPLLGQLHPLVADGKVAHALWLAYAAAQRARPREALHPAHGEPFLRCAAPRWRAGREQPPARAPTRFHPAASSFSPLDPSPWPMWRPFELVRALGSNSAPSPHRAAWEAANSAVLAPAAARSYLAVVALTRGMVSTAMRSERYSVPIRAIRHAALQLAELADAPSTLTPIHPLFLRLCIYARHYRVARAFIRRCVARGGRGPPAAGRGCLCLATPAHLSLPLPVA